MILKKCISLLLAVGMVAVLLAGCNTQTDYDDDSISQPFSFEGWESGSVTFTRGGGIDSMKHIASDGNLELYMNEQSMAFAVKDTRNSKVWYSDPLSDPSFTGDADDSNRALVKISVNDYGKVKNYDSFNHSVKSGQFNIVNIKNGVKIHMAIGQTKIITALDLPQAVEKERFENEIFAKLSEDEKAVLKKRYTFYSLNDSDLLQRKRDSALEKFPILQNRDLYILNNSVPDFAAKEVKDILQSIGYDEEQIQRDNDDNGVNVKVEPILRYDLVMEIALKDRQLSVNLDCSRLARDKDINVTEISLLEMFGASHDKQDEGWLLLPDGSGSIQNISGENSGYPSYSIRIYGEEKAIRKEQQFGAVEQSILPVFGEKLGDSGFVAMIEDGDAIALVNTNLKGTGPFSSIYPAFKVAESALIDAGFADAAASTNVPMTQPDTYTGEISVRYAFVCGEEANLYGMSQLVRNRYQQLKILPAEKMELPQAPLNVEVIGSVDKSSSLLGIFPIRKNEAATTFPQAKEIVDILHGRGIGKINLHYQGWCNGGLYTKHVQKLNVEKVLGGKNGLLALDAALTKNGDTLYPRVQFVSVQNTNGFNTRKMAARALGNNLSAVYHYDVATGNSFDYRIGTYVAPAYLSEYISAFIKSYRSLGLNSLAVTDIGRDLYSEMNKSAGLDRAKSKELTVQSLSLLDGQHTAISTGNMYTWPYADYISSIPLDSSRYNREMYAVPFVQMVIHGLKGYSSEPINNGYDYRHQMLRAVSFGADATFRFTYTTDDFLNGTYFIDNLSTDYRNWLDIVSDYYKRMSEDYKKIGNSDIIEYTQIQKDVFLTVFENGVNIIANYGDNAVTINGQTIEAQDWLCRGGTSA